jgi:hypothetical protein
VVTTPDDKMGMSFRLRVIEPGETPRSYGTITVTSVEKVRFQSQFVFFELSKKN